MKTVGVLTLGCKVNTYESEYVISKLKENNYIIKDFTEICDVYIINTCTVTNTADIKSKKMIKAAIKRNPNACVVAMGCFIEANKDYEIEGLDIVIGNKDKSKIIELLDEYFIKKETLQRLYKEEKTVFEDMYINDFPGRTRAFVKIQDGCENFCSYCIIPFVRGKCRSKDQDQVIKEITDLVNNGYQEIVLTGIHTGSYGDGEDFDIVDLIREVSKNDNLKRIRISSIEITELDEKFMEELRINPKICDHMHVPIQSGSNDVLKLMNRKYNIDEYKKKIEELRSIRPDINITTDLIVGFPEETDDNHLETIGNLKNIGYSKIHTFPYSMRSGTKASLMKQVNDTVKKNRTHEVLELSDVLESEYYKKFIGKELEVLVEDGFSGFTSNYIKVHLDKECEVNTFVKVKIDNVDGICVNGNVI